MGEVEKMMSCKGPDSGCYVYYCPKCGEYHSISFGCNTTADYARIAASGTQINGQAKRLSSGMFDVPAA